MLRGVSVDHAQTIVLSTSLSVITPRLSAVSNTFSKSSSVLLCGLFSIPTLLIGYAFARAATAGYRRLSVFLFFVSFFHRVVTTWFRGDK